MRAFLVSCVPAPLCCYPARAKGSRERLCRVAVPLSIPFAWFVLDLGLGSSDSKPGCTVIHCKWENDHRVRSDAWWEEHCWVASECFALMFREASSCRNRRLVIVIEFVWDHRVGSYVVSVSIRVLYDEVSFPLSFGDDSLWFAPSVQHFRFTRHVIRQSLSSLGCECQDELSCFEPRSSQLIFLP